MTAVSDDRPLRLQRHFDASPGRLFDAWTDPHLAAAWLFTTASSESHHAELDVRVGGKWEITDRRGGVDYRAVGEYLEVERPGRLVFSLGMPQFSEAFTKVTVEIAADGKGAALTLTQEDLPPAIVAETETGWAEMFDHLAERLGEGGYGVATGPNTLRFERLFPGPIERLWSYLTEGDLRGKWLASGPMQLREGGAAELFFRHADLSPIEVAIPERHAGMKDGLRIAERVLACDPPRRLSITWGGPESPGVVTFELTPQGDEVRLALTHAGLKDAVQMANVAAGWQTHLTILADHEGGKIPRPFWSLWNGLESEYEQRLVID